MGVTEGKVQVLPLHRRLVTDTEELQFLLETGRNPDHHVVGERAVQAVASAPPGVVRRLILIAPSSSANTIVSGKDISKLPFGPCLFENKCVDASSVGGSA